MVKPSPVSPDAGSEVRFQAYISALCEVIGHADRIDPLRHYCTGLLLPGERKSIEPMAAQLDPLHVQATHQSLHHFIAQAPWSDAGVLTAVREQVLPVPIQHGQVTAWILDDTGFAKKGKHSVGVARQYCGQLGKQDNCQVAVSLSLAHDWASLPVAFELYLPEEWANDPVRRAKAGVPKTLPFRTKPQIALEQIRPARADGLPPGVVLGDAAYGVETDFRTALTALSLSYVLGVQASLGVWPPGCAPLPPKPWSGTGRKPTRQRRDAEPQPVSAKDLALTLAPTAWQTVTWRAASQGELSGRFAAVRVRPSHRDTERAEPWPEEWLLIEWPEGDKEPAKYWLSTLPDTTALIDLVHMAKLRWRIERDYQELKQELGLDHYEGRGWRGFHHHATLCIAAYGFLVRERSLFPPEEQFQRPTPALPAGWRPRGHSDPTGAT
jgi:SRSO17 transposase